MTLENIEYATGSNELEIEYACSNFALLGYRLILIFSSLIIVGFLVYNIKLEGMTIGSLIVLFIVVIVSLVLWTAIGQIAGTSCGAIG